MAENIPDYKLGRVALLRKKVHDKVHIIQGYLGEELVGSVFQAYVDAIKDCLRLSVSCRPALESTLSRFAGRVLTRNLARRIEYIVAGERNQMSPGVEVKNESMGISFNTEEDPYETIITSKEGNAALPFRGIINTTWVPMEIIESRISFTRGVKKTVFVELTFIIVAGPGSGAIIKHAVPKGFIHVLAVDLGLSRYKGFHHRELVQMWLNGRWEVIDGRTILTRQDVAPHHISHNLVVYRNRAKECLRNMNILCHKCPVGFDDCPRGTHWLTYKQRDCRNNHRGWFDPRSKSPLCLDCQEAAVRRRHLHGNTVKTK